MYLIDHYFIRFGRVMVYFENNNKEKNTIVLLGFILTFLLRVTCPPNGQFL